MGNLWGKAFLSCYHNVGCVNLSLAFPNRFYLLLEYIQPTNLFGSNTFIKKQTHLQIGETSVGIQTKNASSQGNGVFSGWKCVGLKVIDIQGCRRINANPENPGEYPTVGEWWRWTLPKPCMDSDFCKQMQPTKIKNNSFLAEKVWENLFFVFFVWDFQPLEFFKLEKRHTSGWQSRTNWEEPPREVFFAKKNHLHGKDVITTSLFHLFRVRSIWVYNAVSIPATLLPRFFLKAFAKQNQEASDKPHSSWSAKGTCKKRAKSKKPWTWAVWDNVLKFILFFFSLLFTGDFCISFACHTNPEQKTNNHWSLVVLSPMIFFHRVLLPRFHPIVVCPWLELPINSDQMIIIQQLRSNSQVLWGSEDASFWLRFPFQQMHSLLHKIRVLSPLSPFWKKIGTSNWIQFHHTPHNRSYKNPPMIFCSRNSNCWSVLFFRDSDW